MGKNPFKTGTNTSVVDRWRCKKLINILKNARNGSFGKILDVGERSPFTEQLEKSLQIKIENTNFDLNYPKQLNKKYDSIFCFEVLEHLQNPLLFLDWMADHLSKNGKVYLTTPKGGFPSLLMWPKSHYHEIDEYRLKSLFDLSKLTITYFKTFNAPMSIYLQTGFIRPIFRILWGGWIYLEAMKK